MNKSDKTPVGEERATRLKKQTQRALESEASMALLNQGTVKPDLPPKDRVIVPAIQPTDGSRAVRVPQGGEQAALIESSQAEKRNGRWSQGEKDKFVEGKLVRFSNLRIQIRRASHWFHMIMTLSSFLRNRASLLQGVYTL